MFYPQRHFVFETTLSLPELRSRAAKLGHILLLGIFMRRLPTLPIVLEGEFRVPWIWRIRPLLFFHIREKSDHTDLHVSLTLPPLVILLVALPFFVFFAFWAGLEYSGNVGMTIIGGIFGILLVWGASWLYIALNGFMLRRVVTALLKVQCP